MQHIDVNLPTAMHGFRPNRSTETALCAILETIKSKRSSKKKVAILALDCSAAFDILDQDLILLSLKHLELAAKWKFGLKVSWPNANILLRSAIIHLRAGSHISELAKVEGCVGVKAAWERRSFYRSKIPAVPKTRSQAFQRIPLEDTRGWIGKSLNSTLTPFWNDLPISA